MKHFHLTVSISLFVASLTFAQNGVGAEGQRDLLPPTGTSPTAVLGVASPAPEVGRASTLVAPAPIAEPARPPVSRSKKRGQIGDYDFGEVLQTMQASVRPLASELDQNFPRFIAQIDDAITLMEQGQSIQGITLSKNAVDGVLASRENVVNPLWEAQFYLNEQIGVVRSRLAQSLTNNDPTTNAGTFQAQTAKTLDTVAKRVAETKDPIRKKRLIAHYRTLRTLSTVKGKTIGMTPDQRKLWHGVLRVLEQASLAHQQVLMGSESLFAQLDGTSIQLRDYLGLMQTVDGVDKLLGSFEGGGMEAFVEGMCTLQEQMEHFSESMQGELENRMIELETRVDSMGEMETESSGVMTPTSIDDELQGRIDRLSNKSSSKE